MSDGKTSRPAHLRAPGDRGYSAGGRRPPSGVRRHRRRATASSSMEVSPYLAHDTRAHDRRGDVGCGAGRSREPDDQGPGDAGRGPGDRATDRRGDQHQRNAALWARRLPAGGATHTWTASKRWSRTAQPIGRVAGVASMFVSRSTCSSITSSTTRDRHGRRGARCSAPWQGRYREREARYQDWKQVHASPRGRRSPRAALGLSACCGRARAPRTREHQRRALRRVADRPRHRSTRSRRQRSMLFATTARPVSHLEGGPRRGRAVMATLAARRHLDRRSDRAAPRRGRQGVLGGVRRPLGMESRRSAKACSVGPRPDAYRSALPLDGESKTPLADWRSPGKVRRLWARDASLCGPATTRAAGSIGSTSSTRSDSAHGLDSRSPTESRRDFTVCGRARDGRLESLSRCPCAHVRPGRRLSRAPRPRLDRSRADPSDGSTIDLSRRSSSSRASPAPRSSPTSSRTTSTIASARQSASRGGEALHRGDRPGSALQQVAEAQSSRRVFFGVPGSADATRRCPTSGWCRRRHGRRRAALPRAHRVMVHACGSCVPPSRTRASCSAPFWDAARGPRQGHADRQSRRLAARSMAGTAPGRVDGQEARASSRSTRSPRCA